MAELYKEVDVRGAGGEYADAATSMQRGLGRLAVQTVGYWSPTQVKARQVLRGAEKKMRRDERDNVIAQQGALLDAMQHNTLRIKIARWGAVAGGLEDATAVRAYKQENKRLKREYRDLSWNLVDMRLEAAIDYAAGAIDSAALRLGRAAARLTGRRTGA